MGEKSKGTWILDAAFDKWETLRLDPPAWNVHLVIARQQFRYGGREAHIILSKVAERTELSLSTVKRAVSRLQKEKLLGHTTREMGDHYRHIRAKRLADGARAYAQARACAAANAATGNSGGVASSTSDASPSSRQDEEPPSALKLSLLG